MDVPLDNLLFQSPTHSSPNIQRIASGRNTGLKGLVPTLIWNIGTGNEIFIPYQRKVIFFGNLCFISSYLYKDTLTRGVFRTQSNFYDEAFL